MKPIDVFYQGEGVGQLGHLEVEAEATFALVKARLRDRHQRIARESLLFLENQDEPLDEQARVQDHATAHGVNLHVHRCRLVEVAVAFNGETVESRFAPSATLARVKRWAAGERFGMSEEEAGEHVLQIQGTYERPAAGTHIGALIDGNLCGMAFDLVADERMNGAVGSGG